MPKAIIVYDKSNKQKEYEYMAKSVEDGKYHIGYVAIEKPWYSNENMWTYYIIENEYKSGGMCGGAIDLGLKKVIVDKTTIEPYTQIASIKYNQSIGFDTLLVKKAYIGDDPDNELTLIKANDKIPLKLWHM